MNVDTLLHQYFPAGSAPCIEMFDDRNIQQVYRRLVEVLVQRPDIETSLLQGMSYCFYEIMDNVIIRSGGHTLSVNGDVNVSESDFWQGAIVYFELRSDADVDPAFIVDHRTDPAEEFDELFLDSDFPELNNLW